MSERTGRLSRVRRRRGKGLVISSAKRGAYYKSRTRRWLEQRGWQVADMEVVRWVGAAERFPVKRDQFGSDLLAVDHRGVVFIQVKGGKSATGNFPAARRAFSEHVFPAGIRRWVVAWAPRAREPRIVEM